MCYQDGMLPRWNILPWRNMSPRWNVAMVKYVTRVTILLKFEICYHGGM